MPRDLPLGNGDFLVTFDARYQLRDIFYPNVGLENHTVGEPSRFGIWIDGQFAWTGDDGWERHINYEHETLVGDTDLVHAKLGVSLHFRDAVDFDRNLYFKEVTVEDTSGKDRQVRLFQHFDAHLLGNDTGDSAYYDPRCQAVVHYKGRRYFLISGSSGGSAYGLSSFAIGQKDAPARRGRGGTRRTASSRAIRSRKARSIAWAWWPFQSRQRAARLPCSGSPRGRPTKMSASSTSSCANGRPHRSSPERRTTGASGRPRTNPSPTTSPTRSAACTSARRS